MSEVNDGWIEREIHNLQIGGLGVQLHARFQPAPRPGMQVRLIAFSTHNNQLMLNNLPAEAIMLMVIGPGTAAHWEALRQRPFKSDPHRLTVDYSETEQHITITLLENEADTRLAFNLGTLSQPNFEAVPRADITIVGPASAAFWQELSTPRPIADDPFEGDGWQPERII